MTSRRAEPVAAGEHGATEADVERVTADRQSGAVEEMFEQDLAETVETITRERDELLDVSQRLQADFENYKKRMIREQTAMVERATESLLTALLPVLDSFDAAFAALDDGAGEPDAVRRGLELVRTQLHEVLEGHGLETVDAVGVGFDPNVHEAVAQEPGDGEPVIGEVVRTGYRLKGRVLRPAMVKVVHDDEGRGGQA